MNRTQHSTNNERTMSRFVDAQAMHEKHPDTFAAPTREELDTLEIGGLVKICNNFERFWVKMTAIGGNGTLFGIVSNKLVGDYGYTLGDQVDFHVDNIFILYDEEEIIAEFYLTHREKSWAMLPLDKRIKLQHFLAKYTLVS